MIVRKHIRVEVQLEVTFRIEGDTAGTTFSGVTKNISRGGVCIVVDKEKKFVADLIEKRLPRLEVSVFLNKGEDDLLVDIQSKTTWISSTVGWFLAPSNEQMPLLIGASFESVTRTDTEKIDFFIEELIKADGNSIDEISSRIMSRMKNRPGTSS